jgi:two-component system, chemotaxis family, response regulator WspR
VRILIAEGSAEEAQKIEAALIEFGFSDLHHCRSTQEVLELKDAFHVILLDLHLKDSEGPSLCKRLKDSKTGESSVILVTADSKDSQWILPAFGHGASDFLKKPIDPLELRARIMAALNLRTEMARREARERELTEMMALMKSLNENLETLTTIDALTGIPNRRRFDEHFEEEWRRARRQDQELSLIMGDIDFFKKVNDRYGHPFGDEVLHQVGQTLSKQVRRPGDLVARYGGEEFAMILSSTGQQGAIEVAERMRLEVSKLDFQPEGREKPISISMSFGVCTAHPKQADSPRLLIGTADHALYQAKKTGRNKVVFENMGGVRSLKT